MHFFLLDSDINSMKFEELGIISVGSEGASVEVKNCFTIIFFSFSVSLAF